jgi:hypothetical protein
MEAKEDVMPRRSTRLLAYLFPLLALCAAVSLASSGPAIAAEGVQPASNHLASKFCLADSDFAHRATIRASFHNRFAQLQHCRCCGKDENGHCNHQCCD